MGAPEAPSRVCPLHAPESNLELDIAEASLVFPESVESVGRQLSIPARVLDIPVPQIVLDGARIVSIIRELEAAGMSQHVWMNGKRNASFSAGTRNQLAYRRCRQRPSALRDEQVWRDAGLPPQSP